MDPLNIARIKAYIDSKISGLRADLEADIKKVDEVGSHDRWISVGLLLNYIRQHRDRWSEYGFKEIHGTVTLTNSQAYPFNNSIQTVALGTTLPDTNYAVIPRITASSGNAGEVEVSDKLTNGFKLSYTGSAKSATIEYIVIGGFKA